MPPAPADPPARRPKDPRATREALLGAAERLFASAGYAGASTEAIARAAGVNKAMISYHFGGKRGLYEQVLAGLFREAGERLRVLRGRSDAPETLLRRYVEILAETFAHRPVLPLLTLREAVTGVERLERVASPGILEILGMISGIIRRGVERGRFRPVDPLLVHFTIAGGLLLFSATRPLRERMVERGALPGPTPDLDDAVLQVQELVLRGLAVEEPPSPSRAERSHRS